MYHTSYGNNIIKNINEHSLVISSIKNPDCLYLMIKENPSDVHVFLKNASYDALTQPLVSKLINGKILDEYEPDRVYVKNFGVPTHKDNFFNYIEHCLNVAKEKNQPYQNLSLISRYLKLIQGTRIRILHQKQKLEKFKSHLNTYILDKDMKEWDKPFEEVMKDIVQKFVNEV